MTLVTLRPNATDSNGGTLTGGATAHAVLSDDSDASYITHTFAQATRVQFGDLTLPAGAVVKSVTGRSRGAVATAGSGAYSGTVNSTVAGYGEGVTMGSSFTSTTPVTKSGAAVTSWLDAHVDAAYASLVWGSTTVSGRLYELYFDIRYVTIPVVTVATPTGTVSDTNTPTVTWTDSLDTDGSGQTYYDVKIYSAAQYGAGGFDPATSTATASSGITASSATSWADTVILPNATYRAYVRVAQTVTGAQHWSAWAFGGFTISVALPAVPTLIATAQSTSGRIKLDLGVSNLIPNPSFETNTTGWANTATGLNAGATISQDATAFQSGTKSLKIVTTAGSATQGTAAALPQLEAGISYTLSVYVKGNAGAEPLSIAVLTSAGATLPTSSGSAILTPLSPAVSTSFQRYTLTFTPSAATTGANFVAYDNTAAVRTWFIDAVMLASNTSAAPTYADGGPATTDRLEIQRSIDAGTTWAPVRNTFGDDGLVFATASTFYDYEAPNGTAASYRARALHSYTGIYAASDWSASASATWSSTDWWIKHPNVPALNLQLATAMFSYADVQHAVRQGVFQPLGSALPIVVSDTRGGAVGSIVLLLATAVLQDALDALLDASGTLLLQGPVAEGQPDRYVRFGDHSSVRIVDRSWAKATKETLPWVEVALPPGAQT